MRRRHLRGVMAIERQVYTRPWSPNLFIAEMGDSSARCYLVARLGRDVVGYSGLICYAEEAHVTNVAVDPEHHRGKIATRLLHDLILDGLQMGAGAVSLEVRVSNWGARIRRNYYQELQEDALIMWTDDVRAPAYARRLERIAAGLPEGVRPE